MENEPNRASKAKWIVVTIVVLLTVLSVVMAARSSGLAANLWLTLAGCLGSYLVYWAAENMIDIPRQYAQFVTHGILLVALIVVSIMYWFDAVLPPAPYDSESIATFTVGKGGPARTDLGHPFSILSDNVHNIRSKSWYERVEEGSSRNGFLRLYYQLEPVKDREAFVGVFGDFTLPPPRPVNMSKFAGISLRLRLRQEIGARPDVRIVLFSDNTQNVELAYPTVSISGNALTPDWQTHNLPFQDFKSPSFVAFPVRLDPQRVFRIALVVVGDEAVHGHVDIDDIRLFR